MSLACFKSQRVNTVELGELWKEEEGMSSVDHRHFRTPSFRSNSVEEFIKDLLYSRRWKNRVKRVKVSAFPKFRA